MRINNTKPGITAALGALFVLCLAFEAQAADRVAVVFSDNRSAFTACAKELVRALEASDARPTVRDFPISESTASDVSEFAPDAIAAVGDAGIDWARKNAGSLPVVTCLTLDPPSAVTANWRSVSMRVGARDRLSLIAEALPKGTECGVLYGEEQSKAFVKELEAAAAELEIELEVVEVEDKKEVGKALTKLRKNGCDVIIGLADGTVYAGGQVVMVLRYCHQYRLAFVGFSDAFARAGALMAFYAKPEDQGEQAAALVVSVLKKEDGGNKAPNPVRVSVNKKVIKLIRADVSNDFLRKVDKVYGN